MAHSHRYPEPSYLCDGCDQPKLEQLSYCAGCYDFTDGYIHEDTDEYTDEDMLADFADFLYDMRREDRLLDGELGA